MEVRLLFIMNARLHRLTRALFGFATARTVAGALIGALTVALQSAPIARAAGADDTLHLIVAESPRTLNPLFSGTLDEQTLASLAFDTLVITKPDATLAPRLATEVPSLANGGISRDGRTVTFHLRHGVRWHDDVPFTSADVAFTMRTIIDPKVPIVDRTAYDKIDSIQTPNDDTVVIRLKSVYAPFVAIVGTQYPIVPKHLLEKSANIAEDPFNALPIGTGPYRFVRQNRGDKIEYAASDAYWDGAPTIKRISVAEIPDATTVSLQLRQGALDYSSQESSQFAQLRQDPTLDAVITPNNDFIAYAFNVEHPIVSDRNVRRAISMAIDRDSLVRKNTFGTGTPAYADLPPFMWTKAAPKNPYGYDLAGARARLDRAGWRRGPDGVRVKGGTRLHLAVIDFSGSVTGRNIDAQVQSMLAEVGIEVELKYFSPSLYYSPAANGGPVAKGDFDLAFYSFSSGGDPLDDEIYGCAHREPNGFNAARYCSPQMEALQNASLTQLDPKKRLDDVARIQALAVSEAPYVFLYHTPFRVIHARRLKGSAASLGSVVYRVNAWSFAR
jgi:peptide/nickel transport system substrate-binding protein